MADPRDDLRKSRQENVGRQSFQKRIDQLRHFQQVSLALVPDGRAVHLQKSRAVVEPDAQQARHRLVHETRAVLKGFAEAVDHVDLHVAALAAVAVFVGERREYSVVILG